MGVLEWIALSYLSNTSSVRSLYAYKQLMTAGTICIARDDKAHPLTYDPIKNPDEAPSYLVMPLSAYRKAEIGVYAELVQLSLVEET